MRVTRDYAFDLITRVGAEISRCAEAQRSKGQKFTGQRTVADSLWDLKRSLEYRDITPKETVRRLFGLLEHEDLVSERTRDLLRSIAV